MLLILGVLAGCQHQTFLDKEIFLDSQAFQLPGNIDKNHCKITAPISEKTSAPATVDKAERTPRSLTLSEAFAQALETGNVSSRTGAGRGISNDDLISGATIGSYNGQSEKIRVLALGPALANLAMEGSISRFDAMTLMGVSWSGTDELSQGLTSFQNGHSASQYMGIAKPLATGGIAGVFLVNSYQNLANPPVGTFSTLNPQYSIRAVLGIEQPLWKDFGIEVNELLPRFPNPTGQFLNPNSSQAATGVNNRLGQLSGFVDRQTEGILISRLRFDQQRAEFERNVHILILQTEVAYWNLYNKYGQLYANEENLRIMHQIWQEAHVRFKTGGISPQAYDSIYGQYEEFRADRLKALNEVLDAESQLRGIMGLKVDDGYRLVPVTPPVLTEFKPDWNIAVQDALNLRPEMQLARDNLRYHQYLLSIQKNFLKPDLRFFARFEPNGLGSTLTGSGEFLDGNGTSRPSNALKSFAGGHFADYTIGLNLSMPLGYRNELAAVRAARLELAQAHFVLAEQEEKAQRFLASQFRELAHEYARIQAHRQERIKYGRSLKTRLDQIRLGQKSLVDPQGGEAQFLVLDAQRKYTAALVKEYNAIAEYNNALARLEWAKGSILRYNNIMISEGALPQHAQVRAVEHEKERSRSWMLRGRPDSLTQPGRLCSSNEAEVTNKKPQVLESTPETPSPSPMPLPVGSQAPSEREIIPVQAIDVPWAPARGAAKSKVTILTPLDAQPDKRPGVVPPPEPLPGNVMKAPLLEKSPANEPLPPLPEVENAPVRPSSSSIVPLIPLKLAPVQTGSTGFANLETAPPVVRAQAGREATTPMSLAPPVVSK